MKVRQEIDVPPITAAFIRAYYEVNGPIPSPAAPVAAVTAEHISIPVEREDTKELKKWGMGLENMMERCVFCRNPTRYWNKKRNQPCCQACAIRHTLADLEHAINDKQ